MTKYCKIVNGQIEKYNCKKPSIIVGKDDGIYLPVEDNSPTVSKTQKIAGSTYEIQSDKVVKVYKIVDIDIQVLKDQVCAKIDAKTAKAILEVANDNKQKNLLAKSTEILLKKAHGSATEEDEAIIAKINETWQTIETLVVEGNAREEEIQANTSLTAEEILAIKI